ncbi:MAG: hypothetical protein KDD41_01835 [Flavobacteriales bacterium]|nr:hypothetical protein [Flavobacteriales bacterium]
MKTKNLLLVTAITLGVGSVLTSCSKKEGCTDILADNYNSEAEKDDGSCTYTDPLPTPDDNYPSITVSGDITSNTTWTKDKIVFLDGRVIVQSGAELTIQAGTVIKGKAGSGSNAAVLIVGVGGKIHASGTSTEPIVFTSADDQIIPGQIASPNLTVNNKGLWGGVIILGDAPISPSTGTTAEIEGIPAGTAGTTYGGNDVSDNSGEFQYCSVRHGGVIIGAGNEINGLTLGGVGNGTTIDHVEIYANLDDGIEFFGGSVNVSDAIVVKIDDDCYDIDQSYDGTITNFMAIIGPNQSGDAFEIDGPEGSSNATGLFNMDGGLILGSSSNASCDFMVFKSKAQGTLQNVYLTDFNAAARVKVNGADAYANYDGTGVSSLTITGNTFNVGAITGIFDSDQAGFNESFFTGANSTATGITNGFNLSEFGQWTFAAHSGQYK